MLSSCNKNRELLQHTWAVEDIQPSSNVPEDAKAVLKQVIAQMKANFRITYKPNGVLEQQEYGRMVTAKWDLDKDQKIIIISENGKQIKYRIKELNKDKLICERFEGEEPTTFVFVRAEPLPMAPAQPEAPAAAAETTDTAATSMEQPK